MDFASIGHLFKAQEESLETEQLTGQGTRLSETAPWESYGAELDTPMSSQVAEGVAEYTKHRYADNPSNETKEELHRQREINDELSKEYQWLHPAEYADEGPRIGTVIHAHELLNRLRKIGRVAGIRFFYRDHPQPDKITLLYKRDGEPLQVACWVQNGLMPEYSFMRFDEHGVPLNEKRRGWRTCLLQMIMKGLISERDANKEFGVACGPASTRYLRTLFEFRNRGNGWE